MYVYNIKKKKCILRKVTTYILSFRFSFTTPVRFSSLENPRYIFYAPRANVKITLCLNSLSIFPITSFNPVAWIRCDDRTFFIFIALLTYFLHCLVGK